jgi:hypothetical protein
VRLRQRADAGRQGVTDAAGMTTRAYPALWSDGGAPLAGSIELGEQSLLLEGAGRSRQSRRTIGYGEIASRRVGRDNGDRLGGRPTLILQLASGNDVRVAAPAPGALTELTEALGELIERKGETP